MTKLLRAAVALVVVCAALRADAFPAFARKYGVSCAACHVAWPILNPEGVNFRDNGYQFRLGKDEPTRQPPAYVPIALRTVPAYTFTRTSNQPSDTGPVTTKVGGIEPPGVDVLTGGTISDRISFLVVLAGFTADEPAAVESAWGRINRIGGTGWLNLRAGKLELDLPASSHRAITLTSGYAVYGAHPMNSAVGFDLGENQVGVELSGHDDRSYTRYAITVANANEGVGLASSGWSSPLVYGHVQQAFALENAVLPFVRVGALGAVGWWPTQFRMDGGEPIPGTGYDNKRYWRAGADIEATLGYPARPLFVVASYQHGREAAGLATDVDPVTGVDLATAENSFNGGFVEADWVPFTTADYVGTPYVIFARWDVVRFKRGAGDVDGGTIGLRRYLAMGPRASAAVHVEWHTDRVKRVGWQDPDTGATRDVITQTGLLGLDFDY